MQKTIKQWLETLQEPYRTQALANCNEIFLNEPAPRLSTALDMAFHWTDTPEGHEYWLEVVRGKSPVILTPLPPSCAIEALMTIALKKGFDVQDIMSIQYTEIQECWMYKVKGNEKWFNINLKTDTDGK